MKDRVCVGLDEKAVSEGRGLVFLHLGPQVDVPIADNREQKVHESVAILIWWNCRNHVLIVRHPFPKVFKLLNK